MADRVVLQVIDGVRPTDQVRDQTVGLLKDAYVSGALDQTEFGHRVDVALTTLDSSVLAELVSDLPGKKKSARRRQPKSSRARGVVVGAVTALALLGGGVVVLEGAAAPEEPVCVSTGLSDADTDCPAPTKPQAEIQKLADSVENAASQVDDLAGDSPDERPLADAVSAAQDAVDRADQAVADAQNVVLENLGEKPRPDAFDKALKKARKAAKDARKALRDARAASRQMM